jgi:PAS domain S-box-containing protein
MRDQPNFDLHTSEQRFQLLVSSVTDYAIYMLDAGGHIATWNPGARRFKGYEADEITGEHFSRFFTEEDRMAGAPQKVLETAAREGKFEAEGWRVRKDGTRFWAHVVVDPIWDPEGQLLGFAKITRDVTEKKEAERELFRSEQRFRMLVQGVRDYAIYMLDPNGHVTNWNAGAQNIKGYAADEIVGQHFSRFYTEEDRAAGVPAQALERALKEGKYENEAWRVRKDGTRFWAHVLIDPIYDESGGLAGFAKVTRDATEKRQAQLELEEAREALFQAQKLQALGELTGGIAHDFNNLMTVIRGSAELLQRNNLSDERRQRYLKAIVDTADRATTLTSHLLAFGRRQTLRPEVLDVNVRLDALGEVLARTLGSQIEVKLDLEPSVWLIEVDPTQLETALLNAAINARDAMPHGGALTLATRNVERDGRQWVSVAVGDTGEGMPAEVVKRAFEPFFTTKEVGKGTGLGLSQIHGFAAQSEGMAEIDSEPGSGTTLRLLLPRSANPMAAADEAQRVPVLKKNLTVLLVEDNEQVRHFAQHLLEDLHCKVIAAASGEEALKLLEREKVDLLFSDIVMPGMSGVELARTVRDANPDLPVLLATGYSEETLGGAANDFATVRKPYGAATLGAAMVAAID